MAKESFDKEIQFLRMLLLTSGAFSRKQFAERLGISVHTFDKTARRLKDILLSIKKDQADQNSLELNQFTRFNYYETSEPLLLFLFRAKSLKESESYRLSVLLAAMQEQALSATELLEVCNRCFPAEIVLPDEKTIRSDLKYLEEVGVITREPGGRPIRYRLHNDMVTQLTDKELLDLYDFVDVMANTQVPSVQGYMLRDNLKKMVKQPHPAPVFTERFLYKYHFHSRILDEAHLYTLFQAIHQKRKISFDYFTPRSGTKYAAQNTNPLFEKKSAGRKELVLPLKVIYDHQYGRWYLLAHKHGKGIVKYRLEGITQIKEEDVVSVDVFMHQQKQLAENIRYSWLIDTGRPLKVKVRFFNPDSYQPNFVKERVSLQGQWGVITEESEDSFIYEIMVNGITEIKPWLRSFGSSCEVLEPAFLRRDMIKEWKEILSYYESVRENL